MDSVKHEKRRDEGPFESDLDRNPGIGQSKGLFRTGADLEEIEGENTVEGDVENDARNDGGVGESNRGRTNR